MAWLVTCVLIHLLLDERTYKCTVHTRFIFDSSIFPDCISMFDVVAWLELSDFWIFEVLISEY